MVMRVLRWRYSQVLPWVKKVGIGRQVGEMIDGDMCRDMERQRNRRLLCDLLDSVFLDDGLIGSTTARDSVRGRCSCTRTDRPLASSNASSGDGARDGRHGHGQFEFLLQMAAHLVELHVGFGSEQALQKLVDTFAHGTRPAQSLCLYATHGAVLLELCDLEIDIGARHVGHGGAYRHGRLALAHHALYRRIVLVRDHRVSTTSCSSVN